MSNVVPFEHRKTVNERLREHLAEREQVIDALIHNERVNRARLDQLEARLKALDGQDDIIAIERAKQAQAAAEHAALKTPTDGEAS